MNENDAVVADIDPIDQLDDQDVAASRKFTKESVEAMTDLNGYLTEMVEAGKKLLLTYPPSVTPLQKFGARLAWSISEVTQPFSESRLWVDKFRTAAPMYEKLIGEVSGMVNQGRLSRVDRYTLWRHLHEFEFNYKLANSICSRLSEASAPPPAKR